jgi:putative spermidine/putrescine transport system ATP-binding protein
MTVRKNVGFGLTTQRVAKPEIERRVDEALGLVRLTAQGGKLPGQLSGGQQQRVAIARAIVVEPPLVLMDEPLSNLDAKLRLEMRAEIRRIHLMLGCSTIYVTHDQDEALSLADRIVVLRDGQVRQIGTPEDLYARPAHADVAEFMGYRNLVPTVAVPAGNGVSVMIGGARFNAIPMERVDGPAVAAIRPDDLSPSAEGTIPAVVEAAEYRGRDFYGFARTSDGTELYFRSDARVAAGEAVKLEPSPGRVLAYAGG